MYQVALSAGSDMSKDEAAMYAVSVCGYLEDGYSVDDTMIVIMTETKMYFEPEMTAKLVGGAVGSFCPKFAAKVSQAVGG